ncbi:MAG: DinB family protein [Planctomycetota bacterium]|jgi:uncharacterized damage-inducible protein DinB
MDANPLVSALLQVKACFDRSTACLDEEDSTFAPVGGTFTVSQQVAHVAQTIDWFLVGAFRPAGFDRDFAAHQAEIGKVTSLAAAREWLDRSTARAIDVFSSKTREEMATPIAAGPIMGGAPRSAILSSIADHTAHHRGALTVYARLRGKLPALPYG